jgi:hypothetical protein
MAKKPKEPKEPKEPTESNSVPHASREALQDFLSDVKEAQDKIKDDDVLVRQQALRAHLAENYDRKTLQSLLLRAYGDALKSPSQKLGTAKAPSGDRPRTRTGTAKRGGKTRRKKSRRRR